MHVCILIPGVESKFWEGLIVETFFFFFNCSFKFFTFSEMTSLAKGVQRSEMICMLAVPAKMTCIDLMRFVAPSE